MNPRMNPFWRQRIADTFQNTLDAYPRVLMLRVDLRLDWPLYFHTLFIT